VLEFERLHNALAGTVSGVPGLFKGTYVVAANMRGVLIGTSDNAGLFNGTFDGEIQIEIDGIPCEGYFSCVTSAYTWTLTPR